MDQAVARLWLLASFVDAPALRGNFDVLRLDGIAQTGPVTLGGDTWQ
ncbi:MAG TPA: hypothetical protein VMU69_08750 [Bradyrhizobium sp.]|nr:hypothetical protein [Bradyrhizobium sp.]